MQKLPKNDDKYIWTVHAIEKMRYYRLSESLVKRVVRFPKRTEKAIAPKTIGAMQPKGTVKNPREIWVMYVESGQRPDSKIQNTNNKFQIGKKKKIISAWIYPGVTKPGDPIPVPEDILLD